MISEKIGNSEKIYIFGANSRAKTLKGYFDFLFPEIRIISFLVDSMEENENSIDGISVCMLEKAEKLDVSAPVFIATKGIYHAEISSRLVNSGMQRIIPVTVEIDNDLRNEYVKKYYNLQNRKFIKINDIAEKENSAKEKTDCSGKIFMAKSIYDKPLSREPEIPSYIEPIQVGAALTEKRLAQDILVDSIGDNISEKNRQYSELTALYWIWKHVDEDVIGLCHYRRHFVLPTDWLAVMQQNNVDVVLPVPTCIFPNIQENYKERHDASDWEYLMKYLEEKYPADYEEAKKLFAGNLYFPCNMFIMKKDILNKLCSWMFPILFAVESHGGEKADTYQNRYLGFVSERLITLFFVRRQKQYKLVYADKTFFS